MAMSFPSYILLITYFMAALAIASISLVESVGASFVMFASSLMLLSGAANLKKKALVTGALWNLLAAGALVFFIIDYAAFSGSVLASAARFLTILLALKLFDLKADRDCLIACSLVFFLVLAAAASTVSPLFLVVLSLFVAGSISAMVALAIRRDLRENLRNDGQVPSGVFGPAFFAAVLGLSGVSMVMTFALFFALPRMGIGLFERKTLNTLKVTGFSERIDLGTMGPVKQDPTIIMRVQIDGAPQGFLYFRGASLDRYDGKGWSRTVKKRRLLKKDGLGSFRISDGDGPFTVQTILLEPLDTDTIFAASHPVAIEGQFHNLWADSAGSIRLPSPPYSRIEYRAWSSASPAYEPPEEIAPQYIDASYLEGQAGQRVRNLTDEITGAESNDMKKAALIERFLRSKYTYTLDPVKGGGDGPLDDFLFYSKQGWCEHYATAMVMMLRAAGVPARIVTGFTQGEWNGIGNYFIIRQQDAHSWVEAYINGKGWATFDPTPSAGVMAQKPSLLSLYIDLARFRWNRYVIHYTLADQRRAAGAIEGGTDRMIASLKSFRPSFESLKGATPALGAVAVFALLLALRKARSKAVRSKTPVYYTEMLRALEKKGLVRRMDETPLEFAERTGSKEVATVTGAFQGQRYGGGEPEEDVMTEVRKAIEALKK